MSHVKFADLTDEARRLRLRSALLRLSTKRPRKAANRAAANRAAAMRKAFVRQFGKIEQVAPRITYAHLWLAFQAGDRWCTDAVLVAARKVRRSRP